MLRLLPTNGSFFSCLLYQMVKQHTEEATNGAEAEPPLGHCCTKDDSYVLHVATSFQQHTSLLRRPNVLQDTKTPAKITRCRPNSTSPGRDFWFGKSLTKALPSPKFFQIPTSIKIPTYTPEIHQSLRLFCCQNKKRLLTKALS